MYKLINVAEEYILCAASYYNDGNMYVHQPRNITIGCVICGWRHHNCIATNSLISLGDSKAPKSGIQGFLTSKGRFVTRSEAEPIAYKAGQIDRSGSDSLISEELY